MKTIKKLSAAALALILALALCAPAMAATTAYTITIENSTTGHTYEAYQIFSGDLSTNAEGKKVLSNIVWGSGVTVEGQSALLRFGKADGEEPYASAAALAAALTDANVRDFAQEAAKYLSAAKTTSTPGSGSYTISGLAAGYYLVKDTAAPENDFYSANLLKVVGNVTAAPKGDKPDIDKIIVDADDANGKGTALDVGGTVEFKLTSTVPSMDGYTSYTYTVYDTMSAGLTFNNDVAVTIDGTPLTKDTDFTVTQSGQSFTVTFPNFINQKEKTGKALVITYSATLNENALTTDVETNKTYLSYSNNPNDSSSTGTTTEKIVYVYDFDLVIDKYTGDAVDGARLSGAMFVLKNADGKYYHWNDTAKKVEWIPVQTPPASGSADTLKAAWEGLGVTVVVTDENGYANFRGLDSGSYALREIAAPAGYNLVKDDISVAITAVYNTDGTLKTETGSGTSVSHTAGSQYVQSIPVQNNAGSTLPETGGIGTTVFYIAGALLAVGAGVILITRKRMNKSGG